MMKINSKLAITGLMLSTLSGLPTMSFADNHSKTPSRPLQLEAVNLHQPIPGVYSAGQLTQSDLTKLKHSDVKLIINLRPTSEANTYDESSFSNAIGIEYLNIPIASAADINFANADKLQQALEQAKGDVVVHCASGNRVGALFALNAFKQGKTIEQSVAFGKTAGLTRLEPVVKQVLQDSNK
ncbi:hypothetical protein HR060_06380 [Catenovulum sp. SM1970]|uniref:beta-lactamase hydrolase domain-containing protein n=1 Tax=Marinifaba aquimaris TaxID=2741323 RepID=UPI00157466E8|nr:sulfur transferase domain-containing protein [Marinifaba aquimaris]NTS76493.1 hypothetical protein [Marinifaba aquimaris]